MTYFVAINGYYDHQTALLFAMVPVFGPLYCIIQLFLLKTGSPIILLVLMVPFLLTSFCSISYRNEYAKASKATDNTQNIRNDFCPMPSELKMNPDFYKTNPVKEEITVPVIKPLHSEQPSAPANPEAQPSSRESAPTTAVKTPVAAAVLPKPECQPFCAVSSKPEESASAELTEAQEKYNQAMREILSRINKK